MAIAHILCSKILNSTTYIAMYMHIEGLKRLAIQHYSYCTHLCPILSTNLSHECNIDDHNR